MVTGPGLLLVTIDCCHANRVLSFVSIVTIGYHANRAAEMLKRFTDPAMIEESQQLSMFLGTHNSIISSVKLGLRDITGSEDLFCGIVNTGVRLYENQMYMLPTDKYGIIKVI